MINDIASLRVDGARLWRMIDRSSEIGPGRAGGLRRLTRTQADREVRDQFAAWCVEAGLGMVVDQAGNMFASLPGREDLPPVVIGSHLDTTVAGGRFDGVLGVLAGLEIARTLQDAGHVARRPIEVVNWTNEEGTRFAPPMAASSVFAGVQTLDWLHALTDDDGVAFGEALRGIGYDGPAPVGGRPLDSYFELHIEQGPELHAKGLPLGIVTGGYSSCGMSVVFTGRTAHSGPTPMAERRNALVAAARFIAAVDDLGREMAPIGKTTAPRLVVWPNKPG
ncbi:MAG: hydantoinase/carbamoylase family amidase, partial [Pseudomonadota bacterium]